MTNRRATILTAAALAIVLGSALALTFGWTPIARAQAPVDGRGEQRVDVHVGVDLRHGAFGQRRGNPRGLDLAADAQVAALLQRQLTAGDGPGHPGVVEATVLPEPDYRGVDVVG